MNHLKSCQKCGAALAATVLHGLCPNCLVLVTFDPAAEQPTQAGEAAAAETQDAQSVLSKTIRYIGDYELIEEISRGAMGVVFKARQVRLNRLVALKMILRGHFAGLKEVQRFKTEAEAAAALDHPNVVSIYEVGEHEGLHYYSMRLVAGSSLAQCGDRYLEDLPGAARLVARAARAVHHAHQHGILHRDLKPGNILVDTGGQPHITDFGLAKHLEGSSDLTEAHALMGTPAYMALEQALGLNKHLTTAVDIYSLGAVLFHLLTGKVPFSGQNAMQVIKQVAEAEPARPGSLNPKVDRDLETICLKCLEKAPERRYGSAEALAEDLERWLRQEPILARPIGRWERTAKWVRRRPALAALACALMLVTVGGLAAVLWQLSETRKARTEAVAKAKAETEAKKEAQGERRRAEESLNDVQLHLAEKSLKEQDMGGTAALLAGVLRRNPSNSVAANMLLSLTISSGFIAPATGEPSLPSGYRLDAVHPDLVHVLVSSNGVAEAWNVIANRQARSPFSHPHDIVAACFDPIGETLLISTKTCLHSWDWKTGALLWTNDSVAFIDSLRPNFSPDGRLAMFRTKGNSSVRVLQTRSGALQFPEIPSAGRPSFSHDGRLLTVISKGFKVRVFRASDGTPMSPEMSETNCQAVWFVTGGPFVATLSGPLREEPRAVTVWDYERGVKISGPSDLPRQSLLKPYAPVGISPSGAAFLARQDSNSGKEPGGVNLMDLHRGTVLASFPAWVQSSSYGLRFSQDAGQILEASEFTLRVFQVPSGRKLVGSVVGRPVSSRCLFSEHGNRALTWGGYNESLTRYRTSKDRHGLYLQPWSLIQGNAWLGVKELRITVPVWPDEEDEWVPVGSVLEEVEQGCLQVVNIPTLRPASPVLRVEAGISVARKSASGRFVAALSKEKQHLLLWNGASGLEIGINWLGLEGKEILGLRFSNDDERLLVSFTNRTVAVVALPQGTLQALIVHDGEPVVRDAFSKDGRLLVRIFASGSATVYALASGKALYPIKLPEEDVKRVFLNPTGSRALVCGRWSSRLWNLETGIPLGKTINCGASDTGEPTKVRFSGDGRTVVVVNAEFFNVFDTLTGAVLRRPKIADARNARLDLSYDGSMLTFVEGDAAFVFDLAAGRQQRFPLGTSFGIVRLAKAGDRLITQTAEGASVWETRTGHRLIGPLKPPHQAAAFFTDSPRWLGFLGQWREVSKGERTCLWLAEVPDARAPAPVWLSSLAEAIAGISPDPNADPMRVWSATTIQIQGILSNLPADDYYANWARWFLSPPEARRATPNSPYSTQEYVEQLSAIGTLDTLREATRLSPTNALAYARLAKVTLDQPEAATQFYLRSEADHLSLLATTLDPANAEVRRMREELLRRLASLRQSP